MNTSGLGAWCSLEIGSEDKATEDAQSYGEKSVFHAWLLSVATASVFVTPKAHPAK